METQIANQRRRIRSSAGAFILLSVLAITSSCAPIRGYPDNPDDNDQTIKSLQAFIADARVKYYTNTDFGTAKTLRDRIVYSEMQIYEIEFTDFQQKLWGDNNLLTTGGDLTALILNGLGATTGNAATKSALAAASAGIIGAKGAIDKDIYFQRTLPAIMAQMSANRDRIKSGILDNLKKDDASYPLPAAELDLQALQRASSIPDAVQVITEMSTADKALAEQEVEASRTSAFSKSTTAQQISAWIGFGHDANGKAFTHNPAHLSLLQGWIDTNLPGMPVRQLLNDVANSQVLEASRQKAISDLHIPPIAP